MGCTDERLEGGKKGKAWVFLLPACLVSQAEALSLSESLVPRVHDSSFSQVILALGHLALFFQSRGVATSCHC